eukprot:CCRYP_017064-RA/>CCRYP_017064-RA protein AED:0.00 eAED:0.00 QI:51/1/0.5/1/1/0.5/2/0/1220
MSAKMLLYHLGLVHFLALHSTSMIIPKSTMCSPRLSRGQLMVSNSKSSSLFASIRPEFRAKSGVSIATLLEDTYEEEGGDNIEAIKYDLIVTMSELLSGYALALDDDQDATTSFYLQCLNQELHNELEVGSAASVNSDHSERSAQLIKSGVGGTSWEDFLGALESVGYRTKTSISQVIKIILISTMEPILLHPELSMAADSVVPMATPAAPAAAKVAVAATKAVSGTAVDTSNILFNVYMTVSSMLSGLMKSLALIPINPSTIAAAITITVMAFVYKKIDRREWTSIEDVKDDFNMRVPSRMPSISSLKRPLYQLSATQPYTPFTPYLMQSRDRSFDRQSSDSFYQQNRDREYEYYDAPRQGRPSSAFPNGGRRFDQPTSRSVNPPSILQDLTSNLQPRSPSVDPFAFQQVPSQSPSNRPINLGIRSPVVSANKPTSMGGKSYLSDLMSQPPGLDRNRSNQRNDNGFKQLQEGFASINSQLFSGIPSITAMPQPTMLPTSVMMSRRSGAPKPIVTSSARTSLGPERSLMSELITNPERARAMARKQSMYDGGYNDRTRAQRENAFSSQRNRNGNFPVMSPYSGGSSQYLPSTQQQEYRQRGMSSNDPYNNYDQRGFSQKDGGGSQQVSNRLFAGPGVASAIDGPPLNGNKGRGTYDSFRRDRMENNGLNEFGRGRAEDFTKKMISRGTGQDGASTFSNIGADLQRNGVESRFDESGLTLNRRRGDGTGSGREESFYSDGISIRSNGSDVAVKEGIGKSIMNSLSNFAAGFGFGKNEEASLLEGVSSPFGQSSTMNIGSGFGGNGLPSDMGGKFTSSGPEIGNEAGSGAMKPRGGIGGLKSSGPGMAFGGFEGSPSGKSTLGFDAPGGRIGGEVPKSGGLGYSSRVAGGLGKSAGGMIEGGMSKGGVGGGGMSGRAGMGGGMSNGSLRGGGGTIMKSSKGAATSAASGGFGKSPEVGGGSPGGFGAPGGGMGGGMLKSGGLGSAPSGMGGFGKSSGGMMGGATSKGGFGGGVIGGGAGMDGGMSKGGPGGVAPGGFGAQGGGKGGGMSKLGGIGSTPGGGGGFGKSARGMAGESMNKGGLAGGGMVGEATKSGGMSKGSLGGGGGMGFGGGSIMKSSKGAVNSAASGGFGKSPGLSGGSPGGFGAPGGGMGGGMLESGGLGSAPGGGGAFGKSSRGTMGGATSKGGFGGGRMGGGADTGGGMSKGGPGGVASGGFGVQGGG